MSSSAITLGLGNNTLYLINSMSTVVTTDANKKGYINFDTSTTPYGMFLINVYVPNFAGFSYGTYICIWDTTGLILDALVQNSMAGIIQTANSQLSFETGAGASKQMYFGIQRLVTNPSSPV